MFVFYIFLEFIMWNLMETVDFLFANSECWSFYCEWRSVESNFL